MCKICPQCGAIAEFNAYYGRVTCTRCNWESEKSKLTVQSKFMTYYVIKFVWKDSNNFIQTTYAGYNRVGYNWWPYPYCDFNEAEKFDNIEAAKNFYEKQKNYFKIITERENSSTYISKIVINTEDVEKI
uniref:Zinc ribbon domain protein n=1 Tax=Bacteriophage sp. TaxID=38018 RepID=A0A8D9UHL7_9VIRU|nr:MAG TPA: zinc ribbon domain protein [Bacteriophage sp.]